jgi:alpha-D-xyloside xylohydrolase
MAAQSSCHPPSVNLQSTQAFLEQIPKNDIPMSTYPSTLPKKQISRSIFLWILAAAMAVPLGTLSATPIADEPFTYTDGFLAGRSGGSGDWSGPWVGAGLISGGKYLTSAWAYRPISTSFAGSSTAPLYFSAHFTKMGTDDAYAVWLQISDVSATNQHAAAIGLADGKFSMRLRPLSGSEVNGDFGAHPVGEELLLVGKLEFGVGSGSDQRLSLWVNPTGEETAAQNSNITSGYQGWGTPAFVQAGNWVLSGGDGLIDDIRMGSAWADVIPPPPVLPRLRAAGFDETGAFRMEADRLNPLRIYDLKRGDDLLAFPNFIDVQASGVETFSFTDSAPPSGRAFYLLERASGMRTPVLSVQADADGATLQMDPGLLKLQVFTPRVIRVAYTIGGEIPTGSLAVTASPANSGWTLDQDATEVRLTTTEVQVRVNRASGAVGFYEVSTGAPILLEPASGSKLLVPVEVAGFNTLQSRQQFILEPGEAIYGFGQHQDGIMNRRGSSVHLQQSNPGESAVPVFLSSKGYGLLWDNPAVADVDVGASDGDALVWSSEAATAIDYYFLGGPEPDTVIAGYRHLTGAAPMFGKWAWGFWQSKERYRSQQELLDVVAQYRNSNIPIDGIIQDWRYWLNVNQETAAGGWGSHNMDPARYPDPSSMMASLHAQNVHMLISVWPKFEVTSSGVSIANAQALEAVDGVLPSTIDTWSGPCKFVDPFRPAGRQLFWDQVSQSLFTHGIDGWWLDGMEPELENWDQLRTLETAAGPGVEVNNAYPLMHTTGVYEGQRAETSDKRVITLTRSAYAGQQRNAAILWSGDINGTWDDFREQIPAGLNCSASGIPYWNSDIGGFFLNDGRPGDAGYNELFTRWFQFGAFCPMFRVHGTSAAKEMWRFPAATQTVLIDFDRLRYHLIPYIYSVSWMVTDQGYTMMRPLVMDFPEDTDVHNIDDQYLWGPSMLVCPVINAGATSRSVYLPAGTTWTDFWTGTEYAGGQTITAAAPIDKMPLYLRAGSVLPYGPSIEYAMESVDPMEIRVYPGADGSFTLYEDEGDNYNYESGTYATIPFSWDDTNDVLTIGAREGSFPGMLGSRTFRIVRVGVGQGTGIPQTATADQTVTYDGTALQILL